MRKFLTVLCAVGALAGFVYLYAFTDYSDGERVGTIIKFSNKGTLFKTNEGVAQLIGNMNKNEWEFSVPSAQIAEHVKEAARTAKPVVLQYAERRMRLPWLGDTRYYITGVKQAAQ